MNFTQRNLPFFFFVGPMMGLGGVKLILCATSALQQSKLQLKTVKGHQVSL